MSYALTQAAAEYVGVMISNGLRAVGTFSTDVMGFARDNPVAIIGGFVVLIFFWKLLKRR
jgi:hypothetical protein